MSQRVTLTYTVELDELENETRRLFGNALHLLTKSCNSSHDHEVMLDVSTFQEIDQLRQTLATVDIMLSDVGEIIRSYMEYKFQSTPASVPEQALDETLSQLQTLTEKIGDELHTPQEDSTP
tara:strand:- start:799 stop:1164 length:366 start_codon:yes stop_codon:yes gene_type:complete